jgi:peptidoglycan pentaglycine glycine transferase (the first glycine)
MYNFKEVDREVVNKFNNENPKGHIFQTSYWADVKKEWKSKFLGGYTENGELVLTAAILIRAIPYINQYMGYVPRGFTCDYTNRELIGEFTKYLKGYMKDNNISFITVDPDIHINEDEHTVEFGNQVRDMFIDLGYMNKITKNFENIQPNFVFRLDLNLAEEKEEKKKAVFNNFSNKTRYTIKVAQDRGLTVEVYDKSNITEEIYDVFHEIMVITGQRDNFITRGRQYFKDMVEKLAPHCRIYMVKYNYDVDYKRLSDKLESQKKNLERLIPRKAETEGKLKDEQDADKIAKLEKKLGDIEKNIAEAERQIGSFEERINSIAEFKEQKEIYVSGAVYMEYSGKGWYLYGASHNLLRDTMPNFLMQWKMIEDSIDLGCYMYDFRGVSGDLNPENPLYGLYKFKKGFNGKFVEFVGEFDLVSNSMVYNMFKTVLPKFKKLRTKLRNRK